MSELLYNEIPFLDLDDFVNGSPQKKAAFVRNLGDAYTNIGFVSIKNHGLSHELTKKLYAVVEKFFRLPNEVKQKYERREIAGQRGYISKGRERAKGRNIGDLKEFYHIGQPEEGKRPDQPSNIWPEEVEDFKRYTIQAYMILLQTGIKILRAIAAYLELPENYFDDLVKKGDSILRPIHYFAIENPEEIQEGAVRASEHGDINLITLLMGASADGLQVLRRDGKWIPITVLPNQIVVNVGDMLERHTNKKLKSTIHRVVNPPRKFMNTSRFSIPFFLHPVSEMDLTCLPKCIDANNSKAFEDITAGEFLHQRLKEIGLKS
ncbi:MAG: 2-oxoglutarate and iron-dependent oxygenase domain-containing protein [Bacteroidota bacterium]